ncbi:hypothetical protein Ahy_B08g093728 [Arachis hypogaea]|uniref:Aminotransferase-like plant mobile domain-containing protein n=1 Tax=Arachis hypogaea TaxID=3818 RepID=A0A444Y6U2_ARAHY|nr:hypothetical protein Ahy_B08g093728 [Arachis hypogaea]
MEDDPNRIYRLDGVAYIADSIYEEEFSYIDVSPAWYVPRRQNTDWFQELLSVLPPADCIDKFTVKCTWMQETFSHLPHDADKKTVRKYARAYIMMLLSTQLFSDKSGTRMHIRWLPNGSATLSWLYQCLCRVANINVVKLAGFRPDGFDAFHWPLATKYSLFIVVLFSNIYYILLSLFITCIECQFMWMPYSAPEVVQVVHPEILESRHMTLWRATTTLIYFIVDRVLPQLGGVYHRPLPTLDIDFLMTKDGRGGDR